MLEGLDEARGSDTCAVEADAYVAALLLAASGIPGGEEGKGGSYSRKGDGQVLIIQHLGQIALVDEQLALDLPRYVHKGRYGSQLLLVGRSKLVACGEEAGGQREQRDKWLDECVWMGEGNRPCRRERLLRRNKGKRQG